MATKPNRLDNSTSGTFNYIISSNKSDIDYVKVVLDGNIIVNTILSLYSYTNLSQGLHTVQMSAFDYAGNESNILNWEWFIDSNVSNASNYMFFIESPVVSGADVSVNIINNNFSNVKYHLLNTETSGSLPESNVLNFVDLQSGSYELQMSFDLIIDSVYKTTFNESILFNITQGN